MKHLFITCSLLLFSVFGVSQQMQQKIDMKIDSLGNAIITVSMDMNASQWDTWVQSVGNNPAALKREMERAMPGYFLEDFDLKRDDMNRSFELTLTASGICEIDKKGEWSVETDQKDAQLTELTDHKYLLVSSPPEFGGQIQQQFNIEFPKEAKNIEVEEDAFGQTIFTFDMTPGKQSGKNIPTIAGLFLIVVGGSWTGLQLFRRKEEKE